MKNRQQVTLRHALFPHALFPLQHSLSRLVIDFQPLECSQCGFLIKKISSFCPKNPSKIRVYRCADCGVSDSDIFWHKLRTERTYDYVALCAPVCLMEYSLPKLRMLENLEMHGNSVNKYSAARFALLLHACPLVRVPRACLYAWIFKTLDNGPLLS